MTNDLLHTCTECQNCGAICALATGWKQQTHCLLRWQQASTKKYWTYLDASTTTTTTMCMPPMIDRSSTARAIYATLNVIARTQKHIHMLACDHAFDVLRTSFVSHHPSCEHRRHPTQQRTQHQHLAARFSILVATVHNLVHTRSYVFNAAQRRIVSASSCITTTRALVQVVCLLPSVCGGCAGPTYVHVPFVVSDRAAC